jgi:hypothetical protein
LRVWRPKGGTAQGAQQGKESRGGVLQQHTTSRATLARDWQQHLMWLAQGGRRARGNVEDYGGSESDSTGSLLDGDEEELDEKDVGEEKGVEEILAGAQGLA